MSDYATLRQAMCCADFNLLEQEITDAAAANARDASSGLTLIHEAIALGLPESVEILLQRGADLTLRHALGGTPLHSLAWAVRRPGYPVKRMLAALSRAVPRTTLERIVANVFPGYSLSVDPRLNIEAAYAVVNNWVAQVAGK